MGCHKYPQSCITCAGKRLESAAVTAFLERACVGVFLRRILWSHDPGCTEPLLLFLRASEGPSEQYKQRERRGTTVSVLRAGCKGGDNSCLNPLTERGAAVINSATQSNRSRSGGERPGPAREAAAAVGGSLNSELCADSIRGFI